MPEIPVLFPLFLNNLHLHKFTSSMTIQFNNSMILKQVFINPIEYIHAVAKSYLKHNYCNLLRVFATIKHGDARQRHCEAE